MALDWKRIVVGLDAREEARDALLLGRALAEASGAELHLAVVAPRGGAPFERALVRTGIAEELDEQLFEGAAHELGSTPFRRVPLDGGLSGRSAARALYEYAAERGAELIVVGSTHRGKLGRVLPGSVGESLLRGAPCAVAVAPRGYSHSDHAAIGWVGVGYDGTPEAKLALAEARKLAVALGASLRVITVVPEFAPLGVQGMRLGELHESLRERYRGILDEVVAGVGEVEAEGMLEEGVPARILADHGVELDLIVIGSRGYGQIHGALAGSVSAEVIRAAPCPVLVTTRASDG